MRPLLIDVTHHQVHFVGDGDVATNEILARIDRLKLRGCPIADARSCRIREELYERQSRRAEQVRRNLIAREVADELCDRERIADSRHRNVRQRSR